MKALLLLLIALAVPAAVSAQDDRLRVYDDRLRIYSVAVELYQVGQVDDALRIAGSWKSAVVKSDGGRIIAARDPRLAPGVALLMTELARRDSSAGGPERLALAESDRHEPAPRPTRDEGISGALVCVRRLLVDRRSGSIQRPHR